MIAEITYLRPDGVPETTIMMYPSSDPPLAEAMSGYTDDLKPGGRFAYVSEYLGYEPKPVLARLLTRGGSIVEEWRPPDAR